MFRGDGSRAEKLENRLNCLNSFVQGCSSEICKNNLELRKISFTAEEIAQFVAESYRARGH